MRNYHRSLVMAHLLSDIEIARPVDHETNFLIRMQMLFEKCFQFILVVGQTFFGANYLRNQVISCMDCAVEIISHLLHLHTNSLVPCGWHRSVHLWCRCRHSTEANIKKLQNQSMAMGCVQPFLTLKYSTPVRLNNSSVDRNSPGFRWCSNRWSVSSSSIYQTRTIFASKE